jgi:hypothetical protein
MMFSATERFGSRCTSWYTVEMPAACACAGPLNDTWSPASVMVPASMPYTPVSALMSVDLPAPFSPMSECTSPGNIRKSTSSSALTPGKVIEMPRISTTAVGGSVWLVTVLSIESSVGRSRGIRRRMRPPGPTRF